MRDSTEAMTTPIVTEENITRTPALRMLMNMGFELLTKAQADKEREQTHGYLLQDTLLRQLQVINASHQVSITACIKGACQNLVDAVHKNNQEKVYDYITLGTSVVHEDTRKGITIRYIDWEKPQNNRFHVVPEYRVKGVRKDSYMDAVLFANGIPLAVIECKAPHVSVDEAIWQLYRYQSQDYDPAFFSLVQLLIATNKNVVRYATVGTPPKQWSLWDEDDTPTVQRYVNKVLSADNDARLRSVARASARYTDSDMRAGTNVDADVDTRTVTAQDRALYSLCRPERLLELVQHFIIFDNGVRKIARYQQFFVVRAALRRIAKYNKYGDRRSGIIWHAQGSGKSLTMVMLARQLIMNKQVQNARVLVVSDRKNLDKQLRDTFRHCSDDIELATAQTGRKLIDHLKNKKQIILSLIHKFSSARDTEHYVDNSTDIIVLVDESHRTQAGDMHAHMREMLPHACYIGFTGTPIMKSERNSFALFGKMITPSYPMQRAVKDEAVVPLLYEMRKMHVEQDAQKMDACFEQHMRDMGVEKSQWKRIKQRYVSARHLYRAAPMVHACAFDIHEHYRTYWHGTGFKAQLVAPSKEVAVQYYRCLNAFSKGSDKPISAEVIISAPEEWEGDRDTNLARPAEETGVHAAEHTPHDAPEREPENVSEFWKQMMHKYDNNEERYNADIISGFKKADGTPDILIVVDKLLTGFDAPRNTVMYLCRTLRNHGLLQAIARVNRLHEGKSHGYIVDYACVLKDLKDALHTYEALSGFDEDDLAGTLSAWVAMIDTLAEKHAALWEMFAKAKQCNDLKEQYEQYELLLANIEIRKQFYTRFAQYKKSLTIAQMSREFHARVPQEQRAKYRTDKTSFEKLHKSVKIRYADPDSVGVDDSAVSIALDSSIHVSSAPPPYGERTLLAIDNNLRPADISDASYADSILHKLKHEVTIKMAQDPIYYKTLSEQVQRAIDEFHSGQIEAQQYLALAQECKKKQQTHVRDDIPAAITDQETGAYYRAIIARIHPTTTDTAQGASIPMAEQHYAEQTALFIYRKLREYWKVNFWDDTDAQHKVENDIDDFLCGKHPTPSADSPLEDQQIEEVITEVMSIGRAWGTVQPTAYTNG